MKFIVQAACQTSLKLVELLVNFSADIIAVIERTYSENVNRKRCLLIWLRNYEFNAVKHTNVLIQTLIQKFLV